VKIPCSVFEGMMTKTLDELARVPTSKHAGKRLRSSAPIVYPAKLLVAALSQERGFPAEPRGLARRNRAERGGGA
jgi:hypothetical protein